MGGVHVTSASQPWDGTTIISPGHTVETIGGVVSATVTLNVHSLLLPTASVAVYRISVDPRLNKLPGSCDGTIVTALQLSVKVGGVQLAMALHDAPVVTVILVGQLKITGGVLSSIIILKEHEAVFPAASVPMYVTSVVPSGNVDPGVCDPSTVTAPQLSVNTGAGQVAMALHEVLATKRMSVGQLATPGFVLSSTITLKVQVVSFPAASFPE